MRSRVGVVLLSGLLFVVAACSSDPKPAPPAPSPSASASASAQVPALHLPTVAQGAPCPMTGERAVKSSIAYDDGQKVLGRGPVAPIAYYFDGAGATLTLTPEDKNPDGTYSKKVRWLGVGYTGPLLVRAARIDGAGTAFAKLFDMAEHVAGGYRFVLTEKDNDFPATTMVSGPGCYAYQVDGTNFSDVIVFQAALAK
ncbi:hypothetical protein [Cryptosporangium phraense]|uniref:Lipoprotein n=1 Tax=Cryptosporangium phraense TaxID=2593070 RepID=A0A545AV80_9ACTN|nr:hypothetical protein [Cryptosporangium phraense]TQS45181.1 hypothetical protein FL583_08730 [Cryptosporangium phraense]